MYIIFSEYLDMLQNNKDMKQKKQKNPTCGTY